MSILHGHFELWLRFQIGGRLKIILTNQSSIAYHMLISCKLKRVMYMLVFLDGGLHLDFIWTFQDSLGKLGRRIAFCEQKHIKTLYLVVKVKVSAYVWTRSIFVSNRARVVQ